MPVQRRGSAWYMIVMFEPLVLHVDADVDGGWRVALHPPSLRTTLAELSAERVAALKASVRAAFAPESLPAMLPPGRETAFARQEERAGRALAEVLHASLGMTSTLAEACARARASNRTLALLVDAHGEAETLPWELLADAPDGTCLEAVGKAVILRTATGSPSEPRPGPWGWTLRATHGADPVVRSLENTIQRAATAAGMHPLEGSPPPGARQLLFIAGHGEAEVQELALLTAEGAVAPAAAIAQLGARITASLVVVAVCDGAVPCADPATGLVSMLSRSGASAVLAPSGRVCAEATRSLCVALVEALGQGRTLVGAVADARRALRARAYARPEARWYRWALHITDSRQLEDEPSHPLSIRSLLGWPVLAPEAEISLQRALRIAHELGSGFLGVEHLALALVEGPGEVSTFRWRAQLIGVREALTRQIAAYTLHPTTPMTPTPRLLALGQRLEPGARLDLIWETLRAAPLWQALLRLRGQRPDRQPGEATVPTLPDAIELASETEPAATPESLWLEVLGGPEDGRVLCARAGDVLGRYSGESRATLSLYQATGASDPNLSRSHLAFDGRGQARALRSVERVRLGHLAPFKACELGLETGDLLHLTQHTHLLVRGEPR